jgi:uncharacterized membrane protein
MSMVPLEPGLGTRHASAGGRVAPLDGGATSSQTRPRFGWSTGSSTARGGRDVIEHMDRLGHDGWWWWGDRFLPFLLLLIVIGVGVWGLIRFGSRAPASSGAAATSAGPVDRALDEVRLRYARGEIERDEFVARTRDLGGSVVETSPATPAPPPAEAPPAGGTPSSS